MSGALAAVDTWAQAERLALAEAFIPDGLRKAAMATARNLGGPENYQRALQATLYAACEMATALNLSPIIALQYMAVVNGRICLYSDAPMAMVLRTGKVEGRDHRLVNLEGLYALRTSKIESVAAAATDRHQLRAGCNASYRAFVASIKRGGQWFTEIFDTEDARRAGLLNKAGPWRQYPQRMMKFRAETYLARNVFPDAMCGLYTEDEVRHFDTPVVVDDDPFVEESEATVVELTEAEEFDALARQVPDEAANTPVATPDLGEPDHPQNDRLPWADLSDLFHQARPVLLAALGRQRLSLTQWLTSVSGAPLTETAPRSEVQRIEKMLRDIIARGEV